MSVLMIGGPGAEVDDVAAILLDSGIELGDCDKARWITNRLLGTNDERWWEIADPSLVGSVRGDVKQFEEEVEAFGSSLVKDSLVADPQIGLALRRWIDTGGVFDFVVILVRDIPSAADDLARGLRVSHAAAVGLVELFYRAIFNEVRLSGVRHLVMDVEGLASGELEKALDGEGIEVGERVEGFVEYVKGLWRAPAGRSSELLNTSQMVLADGVAKGNIDVARDMSFGGASALASLAAAVRRQRSGMGVIGSQAGSQYQIERTLYKAVRFQQRQGEKLLGWLEKSEEQVARLLKSSRWKLGSFLTRNWKQSGSYPPLEKVYGAVGKWKDSQGELLDPPDLWRSAESRIGVPILPDHPFVDVVVPVHNALDDVRRCLASVAECSGVLLRRLIIVDDGSDAPTRDFLASYCRSVCFPVSLIENTEAGGYTKAANQGMRASQADIVILLNSDTVVPGGWIERIVACAESGDDGETVGVVGALSNAASWQSIPERFSPEGDWMVNELPPGMEVEDFAHLLARHQTASYPRVPLVNGFCMAIRREVIREIGYFDEEAFPKGYGEENDFCFRTGKAGFALAIADDLYVFHAKSKSYSNARRKELSKASGKVLQERYGKELQEVQVVLKESDGLAAARRVAREVAKMDKPLRVLYLATFRGTGGGTHSIVQEAAGLDQRGVLVEIAVRDRDLEFYRGRYPNLPRHLFTPYSERADLVIYAARFEVVIGTLFTTMRILRDIVDANPAVLPGYYIQDYEPMFFSRSEPYYREALESYSLVPEAVCFAKTGWLRDKLKAEHGVEVEPVVASIDTSVYSLDGPGIDGDGPAKGKLTICAMVRPDSPRRSPEETLAMLRDLTEVGHRAIAFGSERDDSFYEDNNPAAVEVVGLLSREGVAEVLRTSDIFLDLSTYQAFGRTGLEAMSCGCVAFLPQDGGASEYVVDGENGFLVDSKKGSDIIRMINDLADDPERMAQVRASGLTTASKFSIEQAALSVEELLKRNLAERRGKGGERPLFYS